MLKGHDYFATYTERWMLGDFECVARPLLMHFNDECCLGFVSQMADRDAASIRFDETQRTVTFDEAVRTVTNLLWSTGGQTKSRTCQLYQSSVVKLM
jgi:hypothetical protein